MERVTSRDVARRAGVAQSTVSYVLAGKGSISAATRERVLAAVAELGYRPNLAARAMRTARTGRLAGVMGLQTHDPARLLAGAGPEAEAAGYALEVHSLDGDPARRGERILEIAGSGAVEGVLSFGPLEPGLEARAPDGVPIVTSAHFDARMQAAGALADATPVRVFIEHLAGLGHTRFLHVAGPPEFASARARREVYEETVARLGLTSLGVVGHQFSGAAGVAAVHALPADAPPLAVIAVNDVVAAGVLRGAAERGWPAPDRIAVTGWDDDPIGPYLTPALTTVANDRAEAGRRAMARLLATLRGDPPPADLAPLHEIRWRESTAAPGNAT